MGNIPVLFQTDAYKLGHKLQQDAVTDGKLEFLYSNYTNRGARDNDVTHVVHFGLQAFIQKIIIEGFGEFFKADEDQVASEYEEMLNNVFGPNKIGSQHIRELHRLGYVPLRFSGVPEGSLVPFRVPSFIVTNTVAGFGWLVNYLESVISAEYWHVATSATRAWSMRRLLNGFAEQAGVDQAVVDWQLHDFSFRGQTSVESAAASGAGHLLSSNGSDTIPSYIWIRNNYPGEDGFVLGSVPASEHAIMCLGSQPSYTATGRVVDETETYRELISVQDESAIVSIVSDTYSLFDVLDLFRPEAGNGLYELVTSRTGKVVFRPDSGDPVDIILGDKTKDPESREGKGVFKTLYEIFGGSKNQKGFIELAPCVGAIYGDSMNRERITAISQGLMEMGFAPTMVFGLGSFFYQYVTRDTYSSAVKATWSQIGGKAVNLLKDPETDNGTKKSATGRLAALHLYSGELYLQEKATPEQEANSAIQPIWENGEWVSRVTFAEVKTRLWEETARLENAGLLPR